MPKKKPIEKVSVQLASWNRVAQKAESKSGPHSGPPEHVHVDARHDLNPFVFVRCCAPGCDCVSSTVFLPPKRASVVFLPRQIELDSIEANLVSYLGHEGGGLGDVDPSQLS